MIRRLRSVLAPEAGRIAASLALGLGMVLAGVGLMTSSGALISRAALRPDTILELIVLVTAVRFFGVARAALRYAERLVSHDLTFRLLARLRVWMYRRLEPLAPAGLFAQRSGDLLNLLVSDVDTLQHAYLRVVAPALVAAASVAVVGFALSFVDIGLALAVVGFLLLSGVAVPALVRRLAAPTARRLVELRAAYAATAVETLQGLPDLLLMNRERARLEELDAQARALAHAQARQARITGLQGALNLFIMLAAVLAVLVIAIPLVQAGTLAGALLAALALGVMTAFEAVQPLGTAWQLAPQAQRAAERVLAVANELPAVTDPAAPRTPADASVRFENVGFGYDERRVLHGIDLLLEPGRRVAVVGPSGAGKSTLVHLLARFWDPDEGRILFGGQDLRELAQQELRSRMAVLPQHTTLFATSVRDNLLLARPGANEEALVAALESAQLGAWARSLPGGLDTFVGEHGLRLSAGERQRIGLARVFLKDAPILVLDEATANLDRENERRLLAALETWAEGRALLMITHRLVGLERFDEIVVLQDGGIVERGTHEELLRRGGTYRRLVRMERERLGV